jgi:glycosyltransferase involved in cell wall biosynthesis
MAKIKVHYALQTCDTGSNQGNKRYASDSKTEIIKKCVTSFFQSLQNCPDAEHNVIIFDDHSTDETIEFLNKVLVIYSSDNIKISLHQLETRGVMTSIKACYDWMKDNGENLVYQVQDDYLFEPNAIFEMIDMFMQIKRETNTDSIVYPYNHPGFWIDRHNYQYKPVPRTLVAGHSRYWLTVIDVSCSFMTSIDVFKNNWDLCEKLYNGQSLDPQLEFNSVNIMMRDRGIIGVMPVESIALHMQSTYEMDPYIDWKSRWDRIILE